MHRRIQRWFGCALAVAVLSGTSAVAQGQQEGQRVDGSPSYYSTVSETTNAAPDSLATRVAELEKALDKMEDKAKAKKAKAAKKPSLTLGGRMHWDTAAFSQNAESLSQAGDMRNGTEMRRVRFFAKGAITEVIDYKVQLDFASQQKGVAAGTTFSGAVGFRDVYMTIHDLPFAGNVRFGQFYECWGLEQQTSSNNITFMERSVIAPVGGIGDRAPGVMMFDWNEAETMTWAIGGFAWLTHGPQTGAYPAGTSYDDNGGYALDMRATFLPWYDEATNGRGLFHTGLSYSYRDIATVSSGTRYRAHQRPDSHLANYVVNTGNIADATRINSFQPEAAFVYGPFSIQTEYQWSFVQRSSADTEPFDGGYIYVSYFLTGENRAYKRHSGVFGRTKPFNNFFRVRDENGCVQTGLGAWELAFRVDYLNLNTLVDGAGRMVNETVGINWYLSPYARIMLNYVHSETTGRAGVLPGRAVVDLVETRVQFEF